MKAVIPVAGAGTNLRPLTYTQPKPLIPVAGKPIIAFIIDQLTKVGVKDFVFVIGYLGEKIKIWLESNYPELNMEFVTQDKREGSGHAIWVARETLQNTDEIIVFFGDTIIDVDFEKIIETNGSCIGVHRVDDPRHFGVVEYNPITGVVTGMTEKPRIPKSDMAMVGFYKIKEVKQLIEALDDNIQNNLRTEGEFPLTDGLAKIIENGAILNIVKVNNWFDCGKKEILLKTNAILLDKEGYASNHLPNYDNTIIIHPVSIGRDCNIKNSIIGPHVTIGNNARITSTIIKNSIIGNYAGLREAVLQNSVIGNDTSIIGMRQSLNIGDNTEIDLS